MQGGREARTIDLYDGMTGQLMHQLIDPSSANKIVSLNLFSHSGDTLLSAAGMFYPTHNFSVIYLQ